MLSPSYTGRPDVAPPGEGVSAAAADQAAVSARPADALDKVIPAAAEAVGDLLGSLGKRVRRQIQQQRAVQGRGELGGQDVQVGGAEADLAEQKPDVGPRHGRLRSGWHRLPAVQCRARDLAVPDQEVDPGPAVGDQPVQRGSPGAQRRGPGQHLLLELPLVVVQQRLEDPSPGAEPAEHRSLAQASAVGQAVHGQRGRPMAGDNLARRGQQKPPVARGVGAFGLRRSPGHRLAHGFHPTVRNISGVKSAYHSSVHRSRRKDQPMSTTAIPDRFTTLPDEHALEATVTALEEHGFGVEVVDDLDAARETVLARIPHGSSVMTNTSMTLTETGVADAINDGGPYDSARNKMLALDFATQAQQMKAIGGQPDYALGSVHAITRDGTLVIASASGSQLASYAWGAANVIFVVGAQKLVPTLEAAHQRIYQHSLPLEDARAQAAYGQHSQVGKILEIHQELPGRIHIVLIRQQVGF